MRLVIVAIFVGPLMACSTFVEFPDKHEGTDSSTDTQEETTVDTVDDFDTTDTVFTDTALDSDSIDLPDTTDPVDSIADTVSDIIYDTPADTMGDTTTDPETDSPTGCVCTVTSSDTPIPIPDNDPVGVTSSILVSGCALSRATDIEITVNTNSCATDDLIVEVVAPSGKRARLHDRGHGTTGIHKTYDYDTDNPIDHLCLLSTAPAEGTWSLWISDNNEGLLCLLNDWSISFCDNGLCEYSRYYDEFSGDPPISIPDNDLSGIVSIINVPDAGTVENVGIYLYILHSYTYELVATLTSPEGTVSTVHDITGAGTENIRIFYPDEKDPATSLSAFIGEPMSGNWTLNVYDNESGINTEGGTLEKWALLF